MIFSRRLKQRLNRPLKCCCVLIPLALWIIYYYPGSPVILSFPETPNPPTAGPFNPTSYSEALRLRASPTGNILLALADMGAFEMAINFFETSLKRLNITSYLFLSPSSETCRLLTIEGIACFEYGSDPASDKRSVYMSKDFVRKMNIRTRMILEALRLGYNVLHSDVDVFFYRDPFDDLPCQDGSCDAAILWDGIVHNAGFLYVHANPGAILLYEDMQKTAETTNKDDQTALDIALRRLAKKINFITLPSTKYACGKNFYELRRNSGDGLPAGFVKDVIVSHNNWIVGIEAKVYRFKEMQQWYYDGNNAYYSSQTRKYLVYENTHAISSRVQNTSIGWAEEKAALQNALMIGAVLDRIVILPQFHMGDKLCSFLCWIKFKNFESVFTNRYREHLFLEQTKVPASTSNSLSTKYSILQPKKLKSIPLPGVVAIRPADTRKGPTPLEIKDWFENVSEKVLRFSDLYGNFENLRHLRFDRNLTFKEAFDKAFITGSYRQY